MPLCKTYVIGFPESTHALSSLGNALKIFEFFPFDPPEESLFFFFLSRPREHQEQKHVTLHVFMKRQGYALGEEEHEKNVGLESSHPSPRRRNPICYYTLRRRCC